MAYAHLPHTHRHIESLLSRLVDGDTQRVRFSTLKETHEGLKRSGVKLLWKEENYRNQTGWWMLFYSGGAFAGASKGLVVRIKTHGEPAGFPRAFKPHLSVILSDGGLDYDPHEQGKYNADGRLEPKSPPPGSAASKDAWADRTHPLFPGFEASNASNPMHLHGAEDLDEDVDGSA